MKTDVIIGELLLRNNCVVIPKFGGFIATHTPAHIDIANGLISSPKKSILFNKQLSSNDGLLITAYAKHYSIPYSIATEQIDSEVISWFESLNNGERIIIDKVGFLYLDSERNICFEQDRFYNLLLQSFGMGQVEFVPSQKAEVATIIDTIPSVFTLDSNPTPQQITDDNEETPIVSFDFKRKDEEKSKSNRFIKYAAAACLLPIAFYSFWIPSKTDVLESGVISFNDFNPFHTKGLGVYNQNELTQKLITLPELKSFDQLTSDLPSKVKIFPLEFDNSDLNESNDIFYVSLKSNKINQSKNKKSKTKVKSEKPIKEPQYLKYKVVVGSFSTAKNAIVLKDQLLEKGYDAFLLHKERELIRVVAGDFATEQEAKEMIAKLATNQITGWIYK